MPRPPKDPIGLQVSRTAKALNRAFEADLAAEGGSLPMWLILLSVKSGRAATQRELAAAVGIEGATLTHHLDGLERRGLIARKRDPANRRVQLVALTIEGEAAFVRLRGGGGGVRRRACGRGSRRRSSPWRGRCWRNSRPTRPDDAVSPLPWGQMTPTPETANTAGPAPPYPAISNRAPPAANVMPARRKRPCYRLLRCHR